jgi:hypothetical protein
MQACLGCKKKIFLLNVVGLLCFTLSQKELHTFVNGKLVLQLFKLNIRMEKDCCLIVKYRDEKNSIPFSYVLFLQL